MGVTSQRVQICRDGTGGGRCERVRSGIGQGEGEEVKTSI